MASKSDLKEQENELKSKYKNIDQKHIPLLFQKKLEKQKQFFDSGDYNMKNGTAPDDKANGQFLNKLDFFFRIFRKSFFL